MKEKTGLGAAIALSILALLIGLFGIAVLIGVGEGANNAIVAFAAVSFPFALLAGFFSFLAPRARWAIGIAMFAPVLIISIIGSWSSSVMLPGGIWTAALTCAGAYLGARLRLSRSGGQKPPPA